MAARASFGRFEPPLNGAGYRITSRMESLLQSRIAEHREFLARRDAEYRGSVGTVSGRLGRDWVRGESLGDEGCEE